VGIGAEVDKELGVAAVGHIPVRNGCRAACVGDYLVLVGLVDLQVTLWIGTVETMRPTLDDEIGSIEAGSIVELMFDELLDVQGRLWRLVVSEPERDFTKLGFQRESGGRRHGFTVVEKRESMCESQLATEMRSN
jgi:hypothetical protein